MPIVNILVALPRITVNGLKPEFTCGFMIDHFNRRVSGAIAVQADCQLCELLRTLRKGDKVDLTFATYELSSGEQKEMIEYSGPAEPILIRMRPRRTDMLTMKVIFRLLA